MKIKEAIEIVNGMTSTVSAKESNDVLRISSKNTAIYGDWFLEMPMNATNWEPIRKEWGGLSPDIKAVDLARVMDVIQQLLDTPVKERFPEKKYRLVVKRETPFCPKYVSNIITELNGIGFDLSIDEKEARIFSDKELNQIKGREPSLAPSIDAMKEEVEKYDRS